MKRWQIALIVSLIIIGLFLADGGSVYVKQLLNRPPKADFTYRTPTRTLKYIAPTDRDLIMFLNNSTDPDGDQLTSNWYVRHNGTGDWRLLNTSRDHWGRLPVSNEKGHEIKLIVSDATREDSVTVSLVVDRAVVYPPKKIGMKFKGVNYCTGVRYDERVNPPPSEVQIDESLEVIRKDLGCNAIKLVGGYEDVMVRCAEKAIKKGFEMIIVSPRYTHKTSTQDSTIEDHIEGVTSFSKRAEELRERSDAIVLCIGEELQIDVIGLTNSSTYTKRVEEWSYMDTKTRSQIELRLNNYLSTIIMGVREHFHGQITYAHSGTVAIQIKWNELGIDIVGPMLYWDRDQKRFTEKVARYRVTGKLCISTEFGCQCWKGAMNVSGDAWRWYQGQEYSQEEQAVSITKTIEVYLSVGLDGGFVYIWTKRVTTDATAYGIVRYYSDERLLTRKLGFYAYQSLILS